MDAHKELYVLACRAIAEQLRLVGRVMMRRGLSMEASITLLHARLDPDFGDQDGMREYFKTLELFLDVSAPERELRGKFHEQLRDFAMMLEKQANEAEGTK